jgi:hypothetical protein
MGDKEKKVLQIWQQIEEVKKEEVKPGEFIFFLPQSIDINIIDIIIIDILIIDI